MNIDKEIQILLDNRLMLDGDGIEDYENAIINIMKTNDIKTIGKMCLGFDDSTEYHEVMFGLVHALEGYTTKFSEESALTEMADGICNMIPYAIKWAETLNIRILNHEPSRKVYAEVIPVLQEDTQKVIIDLLKAIKVRKPELFEEKVDEVLAGVKC